MFRVLKPGGWFAASDWLMAHDDAPSPEMATYIALEDLDFAMASPARVIAAALEAAGFSKSPCATATLGTLRSRGTSLARFTGPERATLEAAMALT